MERTRSLLISNVPAACPDDFVKDWVEAHGYRTFGIRLIRDSVTGTSPSFAYVQLMNPGKLDEAARALDGRILWGGVLQVRCVVPLFVDGEVDGVVESSRLGGFVSRLDTEEITRYEIPPGAHVLSVYLQTHSAESETVFGQALKEIQRRFETESEQHELDECVKRVWDFIHRFEARSPMLAIFCGATGSLWARQIDVVLPNAVRWSETPYWKPLVEAIDEFEPYGVLLVDDSRARLFAASVGRIHEHRFVARDSAEKMETYLARVVGATEEMMRTESPNRLVVAGDRHIFTPFLNLAPPYLQKSIIAMTPLSMNASMQQVFQVTSAFDHLAERRFEIRLVDQLVRLSAEHKKVTLGIRPTLDALNDNRIWRLVYSEDFAARGGRCLLCDSHFSSELEMCKKCDVAVRPVDELMAVIISRALNQDASIEQVRGEAAARLNQVGGIGAYLRF